MNGTIVHNYTYGCAGIGDFINSSYKWFCYCDTHNIKYMISFDCKKDVEKLGIKLFLDKNLKFKKNELSICFRRPSILQ